MYPLVYHLGIDDYVPNEDFEPHLFEHIPAWRRPRHGPSAVRRLFSLATRAAGPVRARSARSEPARRANPCLGVPAIRWG
jgi:hypothetical protein